MSRGEFIVQWVTEQRPDAFRVVGYCVRDMDKFDKNIVFKHRDKVVCEKIARILNEQRQAEQANNVMENKA